jgi:hypothetical protein
MDVESAGFVDGVCWLQVSIPRSGLGRGAINFDEQSMIWAYNAASGLSHINTRFTYHGPNTDTHGAFSAFITNGSVRVKSLAINFTLLQTHGIGMLLMYVFLMPLGVFLARFSKFKPWWFLSHVSVQVTATVGITIFLSVILV